MSRTPPFLLACALTLLGCGPHAGQPARPIPTNERAVSSVPAFQGRPAVARPLPRQRPPRHPYIADSAHCCMHTDGSSSDVYDVPGPLGRSPLVTSEAMGFLGGECASVQFDSEGRALTVCIKVRRPFLVMLDPETLQVQARHKLPLRPPFRLNVRRAVDDTSGGAYFYIDEEDRVVVGTALGTIDTLELFEARPGVSRFRRVSRVDVSESMTLEQGRRGDSITSVMPDWEGNIWYAARHGHVGTVDREGRALGSLYLEGEEIENSFSVDESGVYIVSDHALYRMRADEAGRPEVLWREPYDRGIGRKVGQINQGSGTTPTLLAGGYVAIADNASPRLNLLVYRRDGAEGERVVCELPLFEPHQSATENTFIGYGRSLIVENNAGYDIFRTMNGGRTSSGGLVRVDIREDESGCDIVWQSDEISQTTVPKLSTATGLIYLYTKMADAPFDLDAFYFTAIDYRSGRTVYRVRTGVGTAFDNNWASISLAPDGSAFVGVVNGLLRIRDGEG